MSAGQRGQASVGENDVAAAFREDMRRASFAPEDALVFLEAIGKPADELTVTEMDLFDRFRRAVSGTGAGAR